MADVILAERPLSYKDFILSKSHSGGDHGFKPISLPSCLFDFQSAMVEWALRKGRAALFEDCGLGARDSEDEKHVHPLQLDVIERCVTLRTNPGETVLTPFMGVGSEVYIPVMLGRKGIGFELKQSYFRQAVKNVQAALDGIRFDMQTADLFDEEVAA